MSLETVDIACDEVWKHVSDYLENDVDAVLYARLKAHFAECAHCKAVLDGTRNVVHLIGAGFELEIPAGPAHRLYDKLHAYLAGRGNG